MYHTVVFKIIQPPLKLNVLAILTLILIIQSSCLHLHERGTCRSEKYNLKVYNEITTNVFSVLTSLLVFIQPPSDIQS